METKEYFEKVMQEFNQHRNGRSLRKYCQDEGIDYKWLQEYKRTYPKETKPVRNPEPDSQSPLIQLTPTRYSVKSEDDTRTGTNFRVLLTFDLAILNLTTLPFVIHDSLLFKNVEDNSIDGILGLYEKKTDKQVFISIDKVGSYSERVQQIVEKHNVLKLSVDNPLYGKSWKA